MRSARIQKRLTVRELAAEIGVSPSRISEIEHHRVIPTQHEVDMLGMILGTKIKFAGMEEAKEKKEALEKQLNAHKLVHADAKKRGLGKGMAGKGKIPCPICGKQIHYRVASFNGHIWAKCETDNCVGFIE